MPSINPDCTLCPLHVNAHTVCLAGEWRHYDGPVQRDLDKKVMVIGQSPGRREDWEGRPWVGPAGAELDAALRAAGLSEVYVTNAAKCSPEANDVEIDMDHVRACSDYLEEELDRIKPAYILALGNPAVQRVLGRGRVSEVAGKEVWSNRYRAWVVPAWHPAAILRAQGRRNAWLADVLRFGCLVRGELEPPPNTPPVRVDLVDTGAKLEGLTRLLLAEPTFTYDFEANIPDPDLPGWCDRGLVPFSVAFSFTGREAFSVPLAHPDVDDPRWAPYVLAWLKKMAARVFVPGHSVEHGAWNDVYDGLVLYRLTGVMPYIDWDAMVGAHLLDENAPKSLKWNGRAHLGWPDWDIDARKSHPIGELCQYNGYDAAATALLWASQRQQMVEDEWLAAYFHRVDMPKVRLVQRIIANGIHLDRQRMAHNLLAAYRRQQAADDYLRGLSFGEVRNPRSAAQVAHWLYDVLGLPVHKMGKKHASTDEETINRLARDYPEAKKVFECRRPSKEISTYYRPLSHALKHSYDGRVHPEIRTTSVETGRLASPFHTTPRPEESKSRGEPPIRPLYGAPCGRVLVGADYRQLEARLCAWSAAGRPRTLEDVRPGTMLADFLAGVDVYVRFASQPMVLNKPPDKVLKDERQRMGKVPVLAMLYRISPNGLREYAWKYYEIDWPLPQATRIHTAFQRLYPEFPYWHYIEERKLRHRGEARSAIGRIRRLPGAQAGAHDDIRAGINAPIQSLASDITQVAGDLIQSVIDRRSLPYLLVGDVHDWLALEAPSDQAGDAARLLAYGMLQAPIQLQELGLFLPPGLIDVEVAVGPWGEGKEISLRALADGLDSRTKVAVG